MIPRYGLGPAAVTYQRLGIVLPWVWDYMGVPLAIAGASVFVSIFHVVGAGGL